MPQEFILDNIGITKTVTDLDNCINSIDGWILSLICDGSNINTDYFDRQFFSGTLGSNDAPKNLDIFIVDLETVTNKTAEKPRFYYMGRQGVDDDFMKGALKVNGHNFQ